MTAPDPATRKSYSGCTGGRRLPAARAQDEAGHRTTRPCSSAGGLQEPSIRSSVRCPSAWRASTSRTSGEDHGGNACSYGAPASQGLSGGGRFLLRLTVHVLGSSRPTAKDSPISVSSVLLDPAPVCTCAGATPARRWTATPQSGRRACSGLAFKAAGGLHALAHLRGVARKASCPPRYACPLSGSGWGLGVRRRARTAGCGKCCPARGVRRWRCRIPLCRLGGWRALWRHRPNPQARGGQHALCATTESDGLITITAEDMADLRVIT